MDFRTRVSACRLPLLGSMMAHRAKVVLCGTLVVLVALFAPARAATCASYNDGAESSYWYVCGCADVCAYLPSA